jgi:hypothetical protein
MHALSAQSLNRKRLAAVLELLSSDQPGERQAAAEAAHRLVRSAGLRWADVLMPEPSPGRSPRRRSPPWRELLAACRSRLDLLSDWERHFVLSVASQGRISKKQYAILARLAGRVRS